MNYDEAIGRLTALGDAPELEMFDQTLEPLESAMRTDDPENYAWFVVAVCDKLSSRDLGDWRRQDELVCKYGRLALQHATALPLAAELQLLEYLAAVPASDQSDFAKWWLSALGRLERELDPTFDSADLPLLNVPGMHAERYAAQVEARKLLSRFRPSAHRFVVATYAQNPDRTKELEQLLTEHGVAEDWAAAVREAVRGSG